MNKSSLQKQKVNQDEAIWSGGINQDQFLQLKPIQADMFPSNRDMMGIIQNPYDVDDRSHMDNNKDLKMPSVQYLQKQTHTLSDKLDTNHIELKDNLFTIDASPALDLGSDTIRMSPDQPHGDSELPEKGNLIRRKTQTQQDTFHKIDFVKEIFDEVEEEKRFYPKTFYDGYGFWSRLVFLHIFGYMLLVKSKIVNKGHKIHIEDLPLLTEEESIQPIFARVSAQFRVTSKAKKFTRLDMAKLIFLGEFKWKVFLIIFYNSIEAVGKNIISILMSYLITSIYNQDIKWAYIYGTIISGINMLTLVARHNQYYYGYQFSIDVRMLLMNMVYQKLTEMNAYSIKEANVGKIINLVSGDLNSLEYYLVMIFQLVVMPISVISGCVILCVRFNGAIGLLAVILMISVYPLQILYQKISSGFTMNAKKNGDDRLKLQNELIEGIRLIKMYAWEQAFDQLIKTVRHKEFTSYTKIFILQTLDRGLNQTVHMWASLLFFLIIYYGDYVKLTSANMIPTIQLMSFLKISCVFLISYALQAFINIRISFQRMVDVLTLENFEMKQISTSQNNDESTNSPSDIIPVLSFNNFSCYWSAQVSKDTQPVLKNITFNVYPGDLVAIVGKIGSGKTTLLNSVIMEVPSYQGQYKINGMEGINQLNDLSVGYVEQEPFIFPDTIRRNILFGRTYNVSSMTDDLKLLKNGDLTQIGERGINLSGGQRARVRYNIHFIQSLARALYQMADVYIFDDPLSAVDAKVARSIFNNAIKDFIFKVQPTLTGSKTLPVVLLATHQIQFAIECDYMVVLDEGSMVAKGQYEDVKNDLNMVSKDFAIKKKDKQDGPTKTQLTFVKQSDLQDSGSPIKAAELERIALYKREENSSQSVTLQTYKRYFSKWNPWWMIFVIIIQCFGYEVIYNYYLRYVSLFDDQDRLQTTHAFAIMGILCLIAYVNNIIKYTLNLCGVLGVNRGIHHEMLQHLSLSAVEFFDTNPSGRILNRFSTDLSIADTQVNLYMWDIEELTCFFLVALITLIILQPWFIFAMLITIVLNFYIFTFSKSIITQTKECDLIQRSPLFDLFKKTLSGVIQVRLYKQQDWFRKNFFELSNKCIQSNLTFYYTQRSFGFNIDFVGQVASTIGTYLIIGLNSSDTASFVQALLLLLTFNDSQQWCLRQIIAFDATMNCFNRMFQIIDLVPEAPHHTKIDKNLKDTWPSKGEIVFKNVSMRYRKDTELVLNNMSFTIKAGDKVGCVGRTGAGKSSILQALFRMVEIDETDGGSVHIDQQDISQLGLNFLRQSIAIIPQTPFVFSGTIRRNLDPLEQYSDDQLWQVLKETNLINIVQSMSNQLGTDMTDANSVFSVGEKQLICLARTILSNKKIIVLDEATANVDMKTDEFIQNKIREKFSDCTIITIAHRLNTIADYDKVMVIESGRVAEFGPPLELLSYNLNDPTIDQSTIFATLVKQTGPENSQIILQLAKDHYNLKNKQE